FSSLGRLGHNFGKPIERPVLDRILRTLEEEHNVTSTVGGDAERILELNGELAGYGYPAEVGPGHMLFPEETTDEAVLEELFHFEQHKSIGFRPPSEAEKIDMEIVAQHQLLRVGRRRGWSDESLKAIARNLVHWEEKKQKLLGQ